MNDLNEHIIDNFEMKGELLPIYIFPHPHLTKKCHDVQNFNQDLINTCQNLLYTMYCNPHNGMGLAAPQAGIHLNIVAIDVNYSRKKIKKHHQGDNQQNKSHFDFQFFDLTPIIFINPRIISQEGKASCEEACLSLPGVYEKIERSERIQLEYFNFYGDKKTLHLDDLWSICAQHELDHLNGITVLDYLGPVKKALYRKRLSKLLKKNQ